MDKISDYSVRLEFPEIESGILIATQASPDDYEFVRSVHHAAYRAVVERQFGDWNEAYQDNYFEKSFNPDEYRILSLNDVRCGYVSFTVTDEVIQGKELVVSPEFQGKGIGSAYLAARNKLAAELEVPVLLNVLHQNLGAIALYRQYGFEVVASDQTHHTMRCDEPANFSTHLG